MGKYSEIAAKLPREAQEVGPFQAAVEVEKATIFDRRPSALAARYHTFRRAKDAIESQERELNVRLAATEQLLWKAYEDAGTESIGLGEGVSVGVSDDVGVLVADRDRLNDWARANGLERQMTLYAPTILAVMKQRLLAGESAEDLETAAGVKIGAFTKTTYRRGSGA